MAKGDVYIYDVQFELVGTGGIEFEEEVEIVVDAMKGQSDTEIIKSIASYISDVYGKSNKENVAQWYHANFAIK